MEEKLKLLLKKVIKDNYKIELNDIVLEIPPKKEYGDYAFGGFVLSKELKKNPMQIASELSELLGDDDIIDFTSAVGPYLNISLSKDNYTGLFIELYKNKEEIIGKKYSNNKTIFVDYIGTNVGKILHIGHMCTPNQGQVIINIYKKLGYNVISDSHIGDWGIIFGKLITAYKLFGNEDKLKENAVEHLFELYVKISNIAKIDTDLEEKFREEFRKLAKGNKDSIILWEQFTKESIKAMNTQLNRLNVQPDFDIGESFYEGINIPKMQDYPDLVYNMDNIVKELIDKKIATKNDDGSVGLVFPDETKLPSCILQKRDGTNLYFTSDLCAIKYRVLNWDIDKIIYFVDVRQQLHMKQAFEIAKMAGWITKSNGENITLIHAYNGFISLKDGAMSTREGRIIKLDALLDEAEQRAKNIILEKRDDIVGLELDNLSKIIGIGAIKYGYLKKSRETDVIFDWDEFMSFEGNSGPYIQYAYVRAIRILEKSGIENLQDIVNKLNTCFENREEIELIKIISSYDDILEKTISLNMPHHLCIFSYELTRAFNNLYNNVNILNEIDEEKKIMRLKLIELFSLVLKDAFSMLGIYMPDKM